MGSWLDLKNAITKPLTNDFYHCSFTKQREKARVSRVIELLNKLIAPQTAQVSDSVKSERFLTKQELFSSIATACPRGHVGFHLINATMFDDYPSYMIVHRFVTNYMSERDVPFAPQIASIILSMLGEIPLDSQKPLITRLYQTYSPKAVETKRKVKSLQQQMKGKSDMTKAKLSAAIVREEDDLLIYAEKMSRRTIHCPKCAGTGVRGGYACKPCNETGKLYIDELSAWQELKMNGYANTLEVFKMEVWQPMMYVLRELYALKSDAVRFATDKLEREHC